MKTPTEQIKEIEKEINGCQVKYCGSIEKCERCIILHAKLQVLKEWEAREKEIKKTYRKIQPNCEKCGNELKVSFLEDFAGSKEGTSSWFCPVCNKEKEILEIIDNLKIFNKYSIMCGSSKIPVKVIKEELKNKIKGEKLK